MDKLWRLKKHQNKMTNQRKKRRTTLRIQSITNSKRNDYSMQVNPDHILAPCLSRAPHMVRIHITTQPLNQTLTSWVGIMEVMAKCNTNKDDQILNIQIILRDIQIPTLMVTATIIIKIYIL